MPEPKPAKELTLIQKAEEANAKELEQAKVETLQLCLKKLTRLDIYVKEERKRIDRLLPLISEADSLNGIPRIHNSAY